MLAAAWPAAAAPMVVSVDYRAPAECPSRAVFLEQVLGRLSHVRVVEPGEGARHFEVEVESNADESRARLEFVDADSQPVQREISARDCDEAVSGIALVTALAIDPRLSIAAPRRKSEAPKTEAAAGREPEPEPTAAPKPANSEPVAPVIAAEPPIDDGRDRRTVSSRDRERWYWGLGAALGAVSDLAPSWAPNGLVFAEMGPGQIRARLSLGYADSGSLDLSGRSARFRLAHGRTELCPLAATLGAVVLRPCTGLELGFVHAAGSESALVAEAKTASGLWFAGLGVLRAEVLLSSAFALTIDGQLRVPFLRRSYVFERPELPAFDTPRFGGGVLLGAEARLE